MSEAAEHSDEELDSGEEQEVEETETGTAEAEPEKKSSVGKAVLFAILILLGGAAIWFQADSSSVDSANAARQEVRAIVEVVGSEKEITEEAAGKYRGQLEAVQATGGLSWPGFLLRAKLKTFAEETKGLAAGMLPVLSVATGDLDQAKKDIKSVRAWLKSHPKAKAKTGKLLEATEKFVDRAQKVEDEKARKMQIVFFRQGLGAGIRR